jgi:hypothetical protein
VFRTKRLLADLVVASFVPFLGIWLYEIGNWFALGIQGYDVSLSTAGWIPLGVSAVTSGMASPLTKGIQVVAAVGALMILRTLLSRSRLMIAEALVLSTMGIFLASVYWEMLSLLTFIPMAIHVGVFLFGTCGSILILLEHSELGKPPTLRNSRRERGSFQRVPY